MMSFTNIKEIRTWLKERDNDKLKELWHLADTVRAKNVNKEIHLRGLVEISNYCKRYCSYCGLNAANKNLERYRMSSEEIMMLADKIQFFKYGTIVLQAGEDDDKIEVKWLAKIIRKIKEKTNLAITLSLGEREITELSIWREAGADRYLLRFETSNLKLFRNIHPSTTKIREKETHPRLKMLYILRNLGYEIGSGVMIGIPGQTFTSLAKDILTFKDLDLDMIGVGPYIPHPHTILGKRAVLKNPHPDQVPNSELLVYIVIALTRIILPKANIPATTALASTNPNFGRELALMRGANVIMPSTTPLKYRAHYEIYPDKVCIKEDSETCFQCVLARLKSIGRMPGYGPGFRNRTSI